MKANLIIMAMLLSVTTYAQDTIHPNSYKEYDFAMYQLGVSYYHDIEYLLSQNRYLVITELTLHKAYIDHCHADSVLIGHRYIFSETYDGEYYWRQYSDWYYNPKHPNYDEHQDLVLYDPDYIKVEDIKEPHERPTFEGYVEWLEKLLNEEL